MKIIGIHDEQPDQNESGLVLGPRKRGHLVSLSEGELKAFQELQAIVDGTVIGPFFMAFDRHSQSDLTPTFKAIKEWASLYFNIDSIQVQLNALKNGLAGMKA